MLVAYKEKPAHCLQQASAKTVCTAPTFVIFAVAVHITLAASHQVPTCILPDSWFCTDTSAFRPASEALLRCLHA